MMCLLTESNKKLFVGSIIEAHLEIENFWQVLEQIYRLFCCGKNKTPLQCQSHNPNIIGSHQMATTLINSNQLNTLSLT